MKFIVDAQLPRSLSELLRQQGHDSVHTLDLPEKNRTKDAYISELSTREDRIVITKDSDFIETFLLLSKPERLIVVKTGNIRNADLLSIFSTHLLKIEELLAQGNLIEITRDRIILHL